MAEHLGSLEPTPENIDAMETFLLQVDEAGVALDSKLGQFLHHALTLMEKGEVVVFLSQEPTEDDLAVWERTYRKPMPEGWTADNSYESE